MIFGGVKKNGESEENWRRDALGIWTTARPIERLSEYIDTISELSMQHRAKELGYPILYRGQLEPMHTLLPKIARERDFRYSERDERYLLAEFKRLSPPLFHGPLPVMSDLEWLALAQHFGLATRLLDWTDNALAALWFAINEVHHPEGQPPIVWALLTGPQDVLPDTQRQVDPFTLQTTKVFRPMHIADRIRAQTGWFTVHHGTGKKRFEPLDKQKAYQGKLRRILINRSCFPHIRKALDDCGVNAALLFPDLQGLCHTLNYMIKIEQ